MVNEYGRVQTILTIMRDKSNYVEKLNEVLGQQVHCFEDNIFDETENKRLQGYQDKYIEKIQLLNEQFDEKIGLAKAEIEEAIKQNTLLSSELKKEILKQQSLNKTYHEKSNELKYLMDQYFASERKEINNRIQQRKSAAAYYNNMTKQAEKMSYLYDKIN